MYYERFENIDFKKEDFKLISEEIKRINGSIERLLDFSRSYEMKLEKVSMRKAIDSIKELMDKKIAERKNKIYINVEEQMAEIYGDKNLLRQAFLNILMNANEATEGGIISITLHENENNKIISFEDTGKGMEKATLEKIMEPFYTTKVKGSGIGLAVVKKIMDIHEFEYRIESIQNQGTNFKIIIDKEKNKRLNIEGFRFKEEEILERRE